MNNITDNKSNGSIILSDKNKEEFNRTSHELRTHWKIGRNAAEEVTKRINNLVVILHEEHPDWSITKIAYNIWIQHQDLEGFSRPTILSKLNDENRKLLRNKDGKGLPTKSNNKNLEESSTPIDETLYLSTAHQIKNAESVPITEEQTDEMLKELLKPIEEDSTSNDPLQENKSYLTQQYRELQTTKQLLQEARKQIEQLNEKVQELSIKLVGTFGNRFKFNFDLEVKDQQIPLVVTVFPDKKSGYVIIDEKKAQHLKRF